LSVFLTNVLHRREAIQNLLEESHFQEWSIGLWAKLLSCCRLEECEARGARRTEAGWDASPLINQLPICSTLWGREFQVAIRSRNTQNNIRFWSDESVKRDLKTKSSVCDAACCKIIAWETAGP